MRMFLCVHARYNNIKLLSLYYLLLNIMVPLRLIFSFDYLISRINTTLLSDVRLLALSSCLLFNFKTNCKYCNG